LFHPRAIKHSWKCGRSNLGRTYLPQWFSKKPAKDTAIGGSCRKRVDIAQVCRGLGASSSRANVNGLGSFLSLLGVIFHLVTFFQCPKAATLDCALMYKQILAAGIGVMNPKPF
jgi:hypothetical protein